MGYFCQNFNFVKETIQIAYGIFVTKTNLFRLFDLNDFQLGTKMWNFPKRRLLPFLFFFFFYTDTKRWRGRTEKILDYGMYIVQPISLDDSTYIYVQ
jgi:hypothetical protein